jgi:hypothetical protein
MENFKEKINLLIVGISYEILDEIVSPICGIEKGGILADLNLATLDCYYIGENDERLQILNEIASRFKIRRELLSAIDDAPLAFIALNIILEGEINLEEKIHQYKSK